MPPARRRPAPACRCRARVRAGGAGRGRPRRPRGTARRWRRRAPRVAARPPVAGGKEGAPPEGGAPEEGRCCASGGLELDQHAVAEPSGHGKLVLLLILTERLAGIGVHDAAGLALVEARLRETLLRLLD